MYLHYLIQPPESREVGFLVTVEMIDRSYPAPWDLANRTHSPTGWPLLLPWVRDQSVRISVDAERPIRSSRSLPGIDQSRVRTA